MQLENILWRIEDGVGIATVNRPKALNALDTRTIRELGEMLSEVEADRTLRGVSHIVVDECHERDLDTDFLLIVLRELLPQRLSQRGALQRRRASGRRADRETRRVWSPRAHRGARRARSPGRHRALCSWP